MLVVALTVKLAEPGAPALYTQRRIGAGGRSIGVVKFRRWKYSTGPDRSTRRPRKRCRDGARDLIPELSDP